MRLIRRIHICAGLLVMAQLLIYGIAGVVATLDNGPERPQLPRSTRYLPFQAPPSSTDKQVADAVYRLLALPMTRPIPVWALQRTPERNLRLDFYHINGLYRVDVLEDQRQLRVQDIEKSLWSFLSDVHAATPGDGEAPGLQRAWAYWNEAAMWSLLAFCASGLYLWLASRPRHRWAWAALTAGTGTLGGLWILLR